MIYVCIPARDEADTVGLLLWRIRRAFEDLGREYHALVGDDGSRDHTAEVLDLYAKVSPLTVQSGRKPKGYAATLESLLRQAVELSDRPKRDATIVMHGDFSHSPEFLADFVRKLDSGADLVVGEGEIPRDEGRAYRWTRLWSAFLFRRSLGLAEVTDPTSGFVGVRLAVLKALFDKHPKLLLSDGWAANAELVGRASAYARRIETVSFVEKHQLKSRPSRVACWATARALWRASGIVHRAVGSERAAVRPAESAPSRARPPRRPRP
jgi:glycosyltransferase involved in cell wall biosynthesis